MRKARSESIFPHEIQIVHAYNQCVRQAFLCGFDKVTGKNFEHRKEWSRQRLEHLAMCFAIDVIAYTIMCNHAHQILRSRPDVAKTWTAEEVAFRWLCLSPKYDKYGNAKPPRQSQIRAIAANRKRVEELRTRLSDISWWMRYYSHHMAVHCNREDGTRGHFWEGRFGSDVLEDDVAVLACMIYVDLNPVRAQIAASPEDSEYTSCKDRADDLRLELLKDEHGDLKLTETGPQTHDWERLGGKHSGWLSPIEINEQVDPIGPDPQPLGTDAVPACTVEEALSAALGLGSEIDQNEMTDLARICLPRRASCKGVLPISVSRYLQLLDEAGRCLRRDKRGSIDKSLAPILARLGFESATFAQCLANVTYRCRHYGTTAPPVKRDAAQSDAPPLTQSV